MRCGGTNATATAGQPARSAPEQAPFGVGQAPQLSRPAESESRRAGQEGAAFSVSTGCGFVR
jgi:hypothetical protein